MANITAHFCTKHNKPHTGFTNLYCADCVREEESAKSFEAVGLPRPAVVWVASNSSGQLTRSFSSALTGGFVPTVYAQTLQQALYVLSKWPIIGILENSSVFNGTACSVDIRRNSYNNNCIRMTFFYDKHTRSFYAHDVGKYVGCSVDQSSAEIIGYEVLL